MERNQSRRWDWLPSGSLAEMEWDRRHAVVVWILFAHAPIFFLFALFGGTDQWISKAAFDGASVGHAFLEAMVPTVAALAAAMPFWPRRASATIACVGLALCGGIFTHLAGGFIEAHFHFFVMVALSAIYIDWLPFFAATVFVALHHGIIGIIDPQSVYNHPLALQYPVNWAFIHAFFILSQGAALTANMVFVQRSMDKERTRARSEEAALADERIARRTADERARILAHVSHEVRTPLNAVLGLSQALRTNASPDDARQLGKIHANGQRVARMLDDILEQSRLEADAVQMRVAPTRVTEVCAAIEELMAPVAAEADLHFVVDDRSQGAIFAMDGGRVEQVLLNLVGNACKYTSEGTVTVTAEAEETGLRFTVMDTGVGIDADLRSRLFEPFQQGGGAWGGSGSGVGLGLAISHGLVRLMGGSLDVESQVGLGSTFTVRIPAPRVTRRTGGALVGLRILVVDDADINLEVAQLLLAAEGADVTLARSGAEALATSPAEFDVVLLDLQMPDMDGIETAMRMRDAGFRMPIIALTGMTGRDDRRLAAMAGMDGYATKPIQIEQLAAVIDRALPRPVVA